METSAPHDWLLEPSKLVAQRDAVLVASTLCEQGQLGRAVPVDIYNPSDEPVQLYSITDIQIETVPGTERKVKEVEVQSQSSQELPEEI